MLANRDLFYILRKIAQSEEDFEIEELSEGESSDTDLPSLREISKIDESAFERAKIKQKERKIPKEIGVKSLPLSQVKAKFADGSKRGRNNILSVYNEASAEEKDYWNNWYYNASEDVRNLANRYNIPFEKMAAIVAVLSPGNKWINNLMAAAKIINRAPKINAYPDNIIKANNILNSNENPASFVTGPKVTVFFHSLLDPSQIKQEIVLDSHAINIWFGEKVILKFTPFINTLLRKTIIQDYQRVANQLNIKPMALQATTWYVWKYLQGEPAPAPAPELTNPES